jgi:hypothetical protein
MRTYLLLEKVRRRFFEGGKGSLDKDVGATHNIYPASINASSSSRLLDFFHGLEVIENLFG